MLDGLKYDLGLEPMIPEYPIGSDITMINTMFQVLKTDGVVSENTQVILTHMARTLWPQFQEDCQAIADEYGFMAAFDGAEFELKKI